MAQPQKLDQAGLLSRRTFMGAAAAIGLAAASGIAMAVSPIGAHQAHANDTQMAAMAPPAEQAIIAAEAARIADLQDAVVLLYAADFNERDIGFAQRNFGEQHRIFAYEAAEGEVPNGTVQVYLDNQAWPQALNKEQFVQYIGLMLRDFGGTTIIANNGSEPIEPDQS